MILVDKKTPIVCVTVAVLAVAAICAQTVPIAVQGSWVVTRVLMVRGIQRPSAPEYRRAMKVRADFFDTEAPVGEEHIRDVRYKLREVSGEALKAAWGISLADLGIYKKTTEVIEIYKDREDRNPTFIVFVKDARTIITATTDGTWVELKRPGRTR